MTVLTWVILEIWSSFMNELLTLVFVFVYGTTRIIQNWKMSPTGGLDNGQNAFTFGQVVPLLLLGLPLLAAGEAYQVKLTDDFNIVLKLTRT